jgi:GAF domain-containing protein
MASDSDDPGRDDARRNRDDVLDRISDLFELLLLEEPLEQTVERIAHLTCRTIEGCKYGSVTRPSAQGAYTAVSTSDIASEIDDAQYAAAEGPCLEALRTQQPVRVAPMAAPGPYERFRAAAVERGVRSSFSLPLAVRDRPVGALNLYSEGEHGFDSVGDATATFFADQVAVAISCAELHERTRAVIGNLEEALGSRDLIGQAKGILMLARGISADDAFTLLRAASQHSNRKLRDIADDVVRTGELAGA